MPASQLLVAAGAGLVGAMLFASLITGSVAAFILAYLAPLPLFAVGLALGVGAAAVAAAAGTLAVLAVGGLLLGTLFALLNAVPAAFISRQALLNRTTADGRVEWYPPGRLVLWLAGVATAVFTVLVLATASLPGGLEGFTREFLMRAFQPADETSPNALGLPAESAAQLAADLARYLPGIVAVSWMVMMAVNGALAEGVLVRFGLNRRPAPRVADIELPKWLPLGLAIAAAGAFMPGTAGFIGGNLLLIALATFTFAGLAVVHTLAESWNNRPLWLLVIYSLTIVFTWPAVLLAVLGIIETWLGLRQRLVRPPQT